jgi:hypothetical protein
MGKKLLLVLILLLAAVPLCFAERVNGYLRSDGTIVNSYERSSPNNTVRDNWSYEGNTNPITGQEGHNHYSHSRSSEYYQGY